MAWVPRRMDEPMFAKAADKVCFLDGGGKVRQQKVVAFCGVIAHPLAMEDFDSLWRMWLSSNGLTALHMAKAMSWSGADWTRKREEWGTSADQKRDQVIEGFVKIIRASPLRTVGSAGDSRFLQDKAQQSGRPDLVLFEKTIELAVIAMSDGGELSVLCDWEDGFDVLCVRMLAKLRIQRPEIGRRVKMIAFGDDAAFAALQAADLFAYLCCKDLLRRRDRPNDPPHPWFVQLTAPVVTTMTAQEMSALFDASTFQRMVEAHQ
jgi:hypothetical protein